MSLTQFYTGRLILDYTGKLTETRIRIDQNQSEAASNALGDICNILSIGSQLVETGSYTDYKILQNFPQPNAVNYNTFKLTLTDNVDNSCQEYIYIPSAKLSLLVDNMEFIPITSDTFSQIANLIQPYYKSRLGNLCTLNSIEYVIQRNTLFPSQVGAATFAPQQVKEITLNGTQTAIIEPDPKYILGRVIVHVNCDSCPTPQTATANIVSNGQTIITPESGKVLSQVTVNTNVPTQKQQFSWVRAGGQMLAIAAGTFAAKIVSDAIGLPSGWLLTFFKKGATGIYNKLGSIFNTSGTTQQVGAGEDFVYATVQATENSVTLCDTQQANILSLADGNLQDAYGPQVDLDANSFQYVAPAAAAAVAALSMSFPGN